MIARIKSHLRRFRKSQSGAAITLEFMVLLPLFLYVFFFGIELSIHSIRQLQLDRGVEVTVREIRLNTNQQFTHASIKDAICVNTGGIEDCNANLKLEMVPTNPRTFRGMAPSNDCYDTSFPVVPQRGWSLGREHEVMLLRACYAFKPVFANIGLGERLPKDSRGFARLTSVTAFVQEPR